MTPLKKIVGKDNNEKDLVIRNCCVNSHLTRHSYI